MQQQAELVGPEAVIAEAIGEAGVLEILDPLLGFAAIHIPIVEVESGGSVRVVTTKRVFGPLGRASALKTTRRGWSQEPA